MGTTTTTTITTASTAGSDLAVCTIVPRSSLSPGCTRVGRTVGQGKCRVRGCRSRKWLRQWERKRRRQGLTGACPVTDATGAGAVSSRFRIVASMTETDALERQELCALAAYRARQAGGEDAGVPQDRRTAACSARAGRGLRGDRGSRASPPGGRHSLGLRASTHVSCTHRPHRLGPLGSQGSAGHRGIREAENAHDTFIYRSFIVTWFHHRPESSAIPSAPVRPASQPDGVRRHRTDRKTVPWRHSRYALIPSDASQARIPASAWRHSVLL